MRGYSKDLRERVIAAVASGTPREAVVWRYAVSLAKFLVTLNPAIRVEGE